MRFSILDHIRDGGSPDNTSPNDDWIGFDERVAVVVDGATGLSDERVIDQGDSDAQWLARLAVETFVASNVDMSVRELVRRINAQAGAIVAAKHPARLPPRYAWPNASFIMARRQQEMIEISGLGDCSALVVMSDGYLERFTALSFSKDMESEEARKAIEKWGSAANMNRNPNVLAELRKKRELLNTSQSDVWTLGLVEEAAEHVFTVALPIGEVKSILLMSDGFSAVFETYGVYARDQMIGVAKEGGLAEINAEIRKVERVDDPDARRFARYKRSDDSSAILLEISKNDDIRRHS